MMAETDSYATDEHFVRLLETMVMPMKFQLFTSGGMFTTPVTAIKGASEEAAKFANQLHPDQIVSVTQSMPQPNVAHVTVYYWDQTLSSEHVAIERDRDV